MRAGKASGAFMQLWTRYQGRVIRHLNTLARDVPGANYKTHGERQAAAAVARRAEQRHAREKAKQQAVDEMRRELQGPQGRTTQAERQIRRQGDMNYRGTGSACAARLIPTCSLLRWPTTRYYRGTGSAWPLAACAARADPSVLHYETHATPTGPWFLKTKQNKCSQVFPPHFTKHIKARTGRA